MTSFFIKPIQASSDNTHILTSDNIHVPASGNLYVVPPRNFAQAKLRVILGTFQIKAEY